MALCRNRHNSGHDVDHDCILTKKSDSEWQRPLPAQSRQYYTTHTTGSHRSQEEAPVAFASGIQPAQKTKTPFPIRNDVFFYLSSDALRVLDFVDNSLECGRIVDSKIGEHLAVDLDTCLVDKTHQARV